MKVVDQNLHSTLDPSRTSVSHSTQICPNADPPWQWRASEALIECTLVAVVKPRQAQERSKDTATTVFSMSSDEVTVQATLPPCIIAVQRRQEAPSRKVYAGTNITSEPTLPRRRVRVRSVP
eukprot:m.157084 g.157084  ORF g.157084 m.157084 type:complete len:122 (-) comp23646_c0_seq3:569-934(-)